MAKTPKYSIAQRNRMLDALAPRFNNGYLRLYSGTQPTDADTALAGNTLLAELRFAATAFPAAAGGVLTANALTADSDADATGTASFYRAFESDGTTVICDGAIAANNADLTMPSTAIQQHAQVSVGSFTLTQPVG